MNKIRQDAEDKLKELDKVLKSKDDPRLNRYVQVVHGDGTTLFYQNCFVLSYKDYYLVFSEHCKSHCFHKDDLYDIKQLERIKIEKTN